jgi:hypothetical protein
VSSAVPLLQIVTSFAKIELRMRIEGDAKPPLPNISSAQSPAIFLTPALCCLTFSHACCSEPTLPADSDAIVPVCLGVLECVTQVGIVKVT